MDLSGRIVGGIASLPPIIAFVAINLKFETRSDWHYRKAYAFDALHSRLMYQLPAIPDAENISAIANDRDKMIETMDDEWNRTSAISWSDMLKQRQELIAMRQDSNSSATPRTTPSNRTKGR